MNSDDTPNSAESSPGTVVGAALELLRRFNVREELRNYQDNQLQESFDTPEQSGTAQSQVHFQYRDVQDPTSQSNSEHEPEPEPESQPQPQPQSPTRVGIEARIEELQRQLPTLRKVTATADTLIYLGRLGIENDILESDLKAHFSRQPLLVEHSKLIALNSQYFNKFLGPFYQTKRWKTLKPLIKDYSLPGIVKYIINMTPDTEGMDAVEEIQNLSCPPGVLQWKESNLRWSNSLTLVGGKDEVDGSSGVEEYSRIRHVKSIERFMIALQGFDPAFDSAVKLYTTVMVSKPWNIQELHPLTDWALRWLCADPNTRFIEALPETVLEMAEVMKCASLCKDAFAILVGEAVLDSAVNSANPGSVGSKETIHERVRGDIEEDWQNRIQHARNSFTERIQKTFNDLIGEEMEWVDYLPDIRKIRFYASVRGKMNEFREFTNLIKQFLRGAIYKILCSGYHFRLEVRHAGQNGGDGLYPKNPGPRTWPNLRAQERIFTRCFWKLLASMHFTSLVNTEQTNHSLSVTVCTTSGRSDICADYYKTSLLQRVTVGQLDEAAQKCISPQHSFIPTSVRDAGKKVKRQILFNNIGSASGSQEPKTISHPLETTEMVTRQIERGNSTLSEIQQPNTQYPTIAPMWNKNFNPSHTTMSQAQIGTPDDSTGKPDTSQCTYWSCRYYLDSGDISKVCRHCGYSYCPNHVNPYEHVCARGKQYPRSSANTTTTQATESNRDTVTADPRTSGLFLPTAKRRKSVVGDDRKDSWIDDWSPSFNIPWEDESNKVDESTAHLSDSEPMFRSLLNSVEEHLRSIGSVMVSGAPGGNLGGEMFDYHLVEILTCLNDEEMKYLPLWADGLDDETGGVFTDHIPESGETGTVLGPGGRRYKSRSEESEYSFASDSIDSTVNTSTLGHDGYRDTLPRGQVVPVEDSDDSSVGGWSYIQDKIDVKKGKQPAIFTPDDSEVATTLGALEEASVIDLGIRSEPPQLSAATTQVDLVPKNPNSTSTSRAVDDEERQLNEIFMTFDSDEDASDLEDMEDSDMDIIDADDLMEDEPLSNQTSQPSAVKNSASITKTDADVSKPKTTSKPAWESHDSMANVVYVYKGGKGEDDDDLMTRL